MKSMLCIISVFKKYIDCIFVDSAEFLFGEMST